MISASCVIPACPACPDPHGESFFVLGRIPDLHAGRQARSTCGNDNLKPITDFEIGSCQMCRRDSKVNSFNNVPSQKVQVFDRVHCTAIYFC
jgi:hypothetical protein